MLKSYFIKLQISIALVFAMYPTQAQYNKMDSLEIQLSKAKNIKDYYHAASLLFNQYALYKPTIVKDSVDKLYPLVVQEKMDYEITVCLNTYAIYFLQTGNSDSALYFFNEILNRKKYLSNVELAQVYINLGSLYDRNGNYRQNIYYQLLAEKLLLSISSTHPKLQKVYNNLSNSLQNIAKIDSAVMYLYKSIKIAEINQDSLGMAISYYTLSNVFFDNGQTLEKLEALKKSMHISEKIGDIEGLAYCHFSLATTEKDNHAAKFHSEKAVQLFDSLHLAYQTASALRSLAYIQSNLNEYNKALIIYSKALTIFKTQNSPIKTAEIYRHISRIYLILNQPEVSEKYVDSCFMLLRKNDDPEQLYWANKMKSEILIAQNKNKEAISYMLHYESLKDTLFNTEKSQIINKLSIQYETEKKEAENTQLKLENELKEARISRMIQLLLILSLGFVVGIAGFYIYIISKQHKISIQMHEIEKAKHYKFFHELGNEAIVEADSQNIDGKKLSNKIAKLAKEIRKFAKMEYSPNLDETSLEFQLNDTIINIKESNNAQIALQYRLDAELEKKLSNEIKQSIYRISQELFNNGHKYSGANLMSILIYKSKRNIVIQYDDDGIGTDKETITENKGLRYIQTYVKIFKGNMQVETAPQSGFSCIVELPLPIIYWLN